MIQTATNIQPVALSKGNVILVSKPNSVIQTAQGNLQTLQVHIQSIFSHQKEFLLSCGFGHNHDKLCILTRLLKLLVMTVILMTNLQKNEEIYYQEDHLTEKF